MERQLHPKKSNALPVFNHCLYLFFLAGLVFSFRAVSSISLGLILFTGLITNRSLASLFPRNGDKFFITGCILFLLLEFIALFYTHNQQEAWNHIRLKSGVVITPLAIYSSGYLDSRTAKRLFFEFCILLAIGLLYCLVVRFLHYLSSGDQFLFFYHKLVSPLRQHAVYFSIFVFTGLVFLLESIKKNIFFTGRVLYIILSLYFAILLFLLSSKLVIVFFILYLLYYFIGYLSVRGKYSMIPMGLLLLVILSGILVLTTRNPVAKRFTEILHGDIRLVQQERFTPADYFNGLQFRILQWKLVPGILNENNAWLRGVGSGDAQYYLNQKYVSKNMYTGDPGRMEQGFLEYNTHNQFLQSLLHNGIIGLLVFSCICFGLLKMGWQKRTAGSVFITLLLVIYALTESVFETQYGIIIFTFFPLLVYFSEQANFRGKKELNIEPL